MDLSNRTRFADRLRQERMQRNWLQRDVAAYLGTTVVTVNRWERGIQQPGPYFRVKLSELFTLSAEELGFCADVQDEPAPAEPEAPPFIDTPVVSQPAILAGLWNVPYPRNPFFTGREDILQHLHETLRQQNTLTLTQCWAVSGLGGIGKTQTVLEYAYRHAQDYTAIFWISAETTESILSSFVTIADLLNLPEKADQDVHGVVKATMRWFTTQSGWLLIFDNVEEPELVKRFLPPARSGCLLFTSRRQGLGLTPHMLELGQMTPEEGISFLLCRARLLAPTDALSQLPPPQQDLAREIVTALGALPLALDQAGAYIEATQCCLADYLHLFQYAQLRLLDKHEVSFNHPLSVTKTFALAFKQLEESHPAAAAILTVCAFLAPEAIPEALLLEASLGTACTALADDPFAFHDALKALLSYSLLQRDASRHVLTIHRLVQAVLKGSLAPTARRLWAKRVLATVTQLFPSDEEMQADYWQMCERLLPHARVCIAPGEQWDQSEELPLLNHVAGYLSKRTQYVEAQPLFERAMLLGEQTLPPEHPLKAETLYGLAELSRFQGNYATAAALFQQALTIREHTLGAQHPLVTEALNNLGVVFYEQGKYQQAMPLLQRALHTWEQALGPQHPKVARTLNNLGLLYWRQGRYEQAQPVLQRALRIREQTLGPEHFQVGTSLNNLGYLYTAQGKYAQAESLLRQALHLWQRTLGSTHPQVIYPSYGLAMLYAEQGHYEQAKGHYQRTLSMCKQALGDEHPFLAEALNSLGTLYREQGAYQEAEPLYQQALRIWEQQLGKTHPLVAEACTGLAMLYTEQGNYEQAETMFQRALLILKQTLGSNHLHIAEVLYGQATLLSRKRSQHQHSPTFHERLPVPRHPQDTEHVPHLASLQRGQYQAALLLYQQALLIQERELGSNHPRTMRTRAALAQLLEDAKKDAVAAVNKDGAAVYEALPVALNEKAPTMLNKEDPHVETKTSMPSCPFCQRNASVVKKGVNPTGSQRFRCRSCQHYFTPEASKQTYAASLKTLALALMREGLSARVIAQKLQVHHSTISLWAKAGARENMGT